MAAAGQLHFWNHPRKASKLRKDKALYPTQKKVWGGVRRKEGTTVRKGGRRQDEIHSQLKPKNEKNRDDKPEGQGPERAKKSFRASEKKR